MSSKTPRNKGGRPKVYRSVSSISLRGEASLLEELKAFARWRSFREDRHVSLIRAIFDGVHDSPRFLEFKKERAKKRS